METAIILRVKLVHEGDKKEALALIEEFEPLILSYARKLMHEDAYYDMRMEFICWLMQIDTDRLRKPSDEVLLTYLKKTMNSAYIKYSKKEKTYRQKQRLLSEMNEQELHTLENRVAECDEYIGLERQYLHEVLSDNEAETVILNVLQGYSLGEIARKKSFSRMSVNRWKNSAMKKLRKDIRGRP